MTQSKLIKTTEAASMLGITPTTLRTWDRKGILKPVFRRNSHRFYNRENIERLCNWGHESTIDQSPTTIVNNSQSVAGLPLHPSSKTASAHIPAASQSSIQRIPTAKTMETRRLLPAPNMLATLGIRLD
jgi:hypothetical protein